MRMIAAVLCCLVANVAFAKGEDLTNCRWQNGTTIDQKLCDKMRRWAAEDRAKQEQEERNLQAAEARMAEERAQREAKKAADDRLDAELRAKWEKEEAARKAEMERMYREQEQADQRRAAFLAARKAECGEDFESPKVGMTLERAKRCVGNFKLISQLNRADGVISTYRAGPVQIHEMNGRIVAWDRY